MKLDERELATVLAALRFWQRVALSREEASPEDSIATNDGELSLMDEGEIDSLCERLNSDDCDHDLLPACEAMIEAWECRCPEAGIVKIKDVIEKAKGVAE